MAAIPLGLGVGVWICTDLQTGIIAGVCALIGWAAAWADAGPDPMDGEPMR